MTILSSRTGDFLDSQAPLPDNQWELEVEHWFQGMLSYTQRSVVELASGPTNPAMRKYRKYANETEKENACGRQKVRSDSFTSFSVLGLGIIILVSISIISVSVLLPWVTKKIQLKSHPYKSLEWITNNTLQLQRLAHEALDAGTWKGAYDSYPTTEAGERLAMLDITDPSHPKLKFVPSKDVERPDVGET
jgi:hypothetical protein